MFFVRSVPRPYGRGYCMSALRAWGAAWLRSETSFEIQSCDKFGVSVERLTLEQRIHVACSAEHPFNLDPICERPEVDHVVADGDAAQVWGKLGAGLAH
jgi:hypothetical protein